MENLYNYLSKLLEIPTVSGFESENIEKIAEVSMEYADGFFGGYTLLPSGSLLFEKKCTEKNAKKLIIDAHIDTIGFAVAEICQGGFVKVSALGGIDCGILPASPVKFYGKEEVSGVFTSIPPHLASKSKDKEEKLKISDLYVDTGLSAEKLGEICPVGTPGGFACRPSMLRNGITASPSLDDKACCAAAMYACRELAQSKISPKCDVYVHFSTGEERTALGGRTLPYVTDADGCIVLDVNFAVTDGVKEYEALHMGKGSGVSYSVTIKRELTEFIADTAEKYGIPLQKVVEMRSTGTNATQIHRNGIPSAVLSVPLKNMHTFAEEASLWDIKSCGELLAKTIAEFHNYSEFEL